MSPARRTLLSEVLRYLGPGFVVTLGFIDPGNWATNIAAGATYGYDLLWVVLGSTLVLTMLQNMAARVGIVTGRSLAANVRAHFSRPVSAGIGVIIVAACAATDLAEYLGAAIGFNLLFGMPLALGALLTVLIVFAAILLQRYRSLERMIVVFLGVVAACYLVELALVDWSPSATAAGLVIPKLGGGRLFLAIAVMGAVVMPHNLFLHSNVVLSRETAPGGPARRRAILLEKIDTVLAFTMGFLVNSSMMVVAAAVFFAAGVQVDGIEQAAATLEPLVGPLARVLFGVALLFAGIGSSLTSSLAEANVVTAFLGKPEDPRTLAYRVGLVVTSIPSLVVILAGADPFKSLLWSQVALSLALPFTIAPLLVICRSARRMGEFRSGWLETLVVGAVGAGVMAMNAVLVWDALS